MYICIYKKNKVLPILEILYHVEDRNSHHVYMALIILLILTEDDTFNRSIHEVVGETSFSASFFGLSQRAGAA